MFLSKDTLSKNEKEHLSGNNYKEAVINLVSLKLSFIQNFKLN